VLLVGLAIFGLGFGLTVTPRSTAAVESLGPRLYGMASAAVTVARMAGMAVGLAVLTAFGTGRIEALSVVITDQAARDAVLPQELRDSDAAWGQRIAEIGKIAVACHDAGFRLSYHNHAFEFTDRVGGHEAHDAIFASVSPDLLKAELDTFFIQDVGKDPAAYIRRYAGRLPLLHLKEKAKPSAGTQNAEVGDGIIDWDAVFAAAEGAGVEWYLVEQNCEAFPALQSIGMSLDFLRRRGVA
jgi:sugar phosphate isomerase/epimerase